MDLLFRLLALLVAARLAAELAERMRMPAVLVEITAGVLLGPSLLGFVGHEESLHFLGELGAIFLLMEVGLHMDLDDLQRVGRSAMQVAVLGIVVPMALAFITLRWMGIDVTVAMFLAAGITATSVGITARVFADMRSLASAEARTVLGAAVGDDVIGLLILTVVARLATNGSVDIASVALIAVTGLAFVGVATAVGARLVPFLFDRLMTRASTEGTLIGTAVACTLAFAGLAAAAGLAPIVGAFVAGVCLARIKAQAGLRERLAPVTHLFVPVFFLLIGAEARVRALGDERTLVLIAILGAIGVIGKLAAGLGVRKGTADRLVVGIGMIPRGEVGVVFATLGLASGALGEREHAALLFVVLATTVIAPPWLRRRMEKVGETAGGESATPKPRLGSSDLSDVEPAVWRRVDQGAVLVALLAGDAVQGSDAQDVAQRLASTLSLSDEQIENVRFLVRESNLLPAAASRVSMGREQTVVELAAHIGSLETADALYLLATAAASDPTQREALRELHGLIRNVLTRADASGDAEPRLAEARRQAAIGALADPGMSHVLDAAPHRYLLAHPPDVIAKHARMLESPLAKNEARVHADPLPDGGWRVHLITHDRPGLLAAMCHVFMTHGVPIREAQVSTWPNGIAVNVFDAAHHADWQNLRNEIQDFPEGRRNGGPVRIEGRLTVDNDASPWHTIVEVEAEDRTGLLYRVAEAITRAGLTIHHATARTAHDIAIDTFLVTDGKGHKLGPRSDRSLRDAFAGKAPKGLDLRGAVVARRG